MVKKMEPVYIIAELSANHNQSLNDAKCLISAAKQAGADAVKIQTYTPDTMTLDLKTDIFKIKKGTSWEGQYLYDLYKDAYMPWEWQKELKDYTRSLGLDFLSTAYDPTSVDFLESIGVTAYKVASFELIDLELIEKIARCGKLMILSTGMATLGEIEDAVKTIRNVGCNKIALLKCTSAYPAPPEEMNLNTLPHLAKTFNAIVGISDHTLGITIPVAAVALGARIVEKHITLSRAIPSPDNAFSIEPHEFTMMVRAIRETEQALGTVCYSPTKTECKSMDFRRSLFVVKDIKKGERFTDENIRSIRPGFGLPPKFLPIIRMTTASRDVLRGTPLSWVDLFQHKENK